jgi:hypothetical protein
MGVYAEPAACTILKVGSLSRVAGAETKVQYLFTARSKQALPGIFDRF